MGIVALDHVQLAMPGGEEDKARAFYAGVLGLAEQVKPKNLGAARRRLVRYRRPQGPSRRRGRVPPRPQGASGLSREEPRRAEGALRGSRLPDRR